MYLIYRITTLVVNIVVERGGSIDWFNSTNIDLCAISHIYCITQTDELFYLCCM